MPIVFVSDTESEDSKLIIVINNYTKEFGFWYLFYQSFTLT